MAHWLETSAVPAAIAAALLRPEPVARPAWLTYGVTDVLDITEVLVTMATIVCRLRVAVPSRRSPAASR